VGEGEGAVIPLATALIAVLRHVADVDGALNIYERAYQVSPVVTSPYLGEEE